MKERKTFLLPGIEPQPSSPQPITIPTELSWLYQHTHMSRVCGDNFKIDLRVICEGGWTQFMWFIVETSCGLFVDTVMNLLLP
jgi:hypothetical protein